jgi:transposase
MTRRTLHATAARVIVERSDQPKNFVVLPKRWIGERTFARLGRSLRLAKDWECLNRKAIPFLPPPRLHPPHAAKTMQSHMMFSDSLSQIRT